MGFMIVPLDLKTEELEIWKLLYSKADYNTMLSKYTKGQLLADSNPLLQLTDKKIRTILSKLIKQGYVYEVKKGAKGTPSIFYLDKDCVINGQLKGNQGADMGQLKGNKNLDIPTNSDHKGQLMGNNGAINGQLKGNPINKIKEKEKKKDTTEVAAVLSYYDSLENLPKYKGLSAQRKSHVNARINEYGIEEVKNVLDKADASDFLRSSIGGNWYNFDWIFNPTNFLKILECNYDNKEEEQRKVIRLETNQGLVYNNSKNGFARRLME